MHKKHHISATLRSCLVMEERSIINVTLKRLNIHTDIRKSFKGQLKGKWLCCVRSYRLSSVSTKQGVVDVCCDQVDVEAVRKLPLLISAITDKEGIQSLDTLRWKELTVTDMSNFIVRVLESSSGKTRIVKLNDDSFITLAFKRDAA